MNSYKNYIYKKKKNHRHTTKFGETAINIYKNKNKILGLKHP